MYIFTLDFWQFHTWVLYLHYFLSSLPHSNSFPTPTLWISQPPFLYCCYIDKSISIFPSTYKNYINLSVCLCIHISILLTFFSFIYMYICLGWPTTCYFVTWQKTLNWRRLLLSVHLHLRMRFCKVLSIYTCMSSIAITIKVFFRQLYC